MSRFEILCVTMHQNDFSKIEQMNIHSDVVFANQADTTRFDELEFDGHRARMITTDTRGVGVNRNLALTYAKGEICLFADDDVSYSDDMEQRVLAEFDAHPDADIIIFHLDTDSERKQIKYSQTKKCSRFSRMPWGAVRVAFRLSSVKKANIWFTTLFGGGCVFPSGEDSIWLADIRKKGLCFYVSKETIGTIDLENSTWFTGYDEKLFYSKGAYCAQMYPSFPKVWALYYLFRYRTHKPLSLKQKYQWIKNGVVGYKRTMTFDEYSEFIVNFR